MTEQRIAVFHGPNLRLLGRREPEIYGDATLEAIDAALWELADELGVKLETFQSNHEGEVLDHLESVASRTDGFLVNAAAWTHTSVAIRDGLVGVGRPFVEVHLSNTAAREPFRHGSLLASVAAGVVYGFGVQSYLLGLRGLVAHLRDRARSGAPHD
ncbi:MAG: type II 3-dehydroquinate dehydratase [Longimicrobiales bacterium]